MLAFVVSANSGDSVRGSSYIKSIGDTNWLRVRLGDGKQNKI
jgi:hypothetical protein